jgi:nitrite reductase/ring-hydroxylating ferredoxin subunit
MRDMSDDGWVSVAALEDLPEGGSAANVDGVAVLLYRSGARIFAVGSRCTHQGAPLARGPIRESGSDVIVTCPMHGSMFRLADGKVMRPPARDPLPVFEVRIASGQVELRANG